MVAVLPYQRIKLALHSYIIVEARTTELDKHSCSNATTVLLHAVIVETKSFRTLMLLEISLCFRLM